MRRLSHCHQVGKEVWFLQDSCGPAALRNLNYECPRVACQTFNSNHLFYLMFYHGFNALHISEIITNHKICQVSESDFYISLPCCYSVVFTVNDEARLSYRGWKQAHLMTAASVCETTHGTSCSDYTHHMREKHCKNHQTKLCHCLPNRTLIYCSFSKNKIMRLQIWPEDGG